MTGDHGETVARRCFRRPSKKLADVFRRAAEPRLGETERNNGRVVLHRFDQFPLHHADAPRVHRLGRVGAVLCVGEPHGPSGQPHFALAGLDVEECQFHCRRRCKAGEPDQAEQDRRETHPRIMTRAVDSLRSPGRDRRTIERKSQLRPFGLGQALGRRGEPARPRRQPVVWCFSLRLCSALLRNGSGGTSSGRTTAFNCHFLVWTRGTGIALEPF